MSDIDQRKIERVAKAIYDSHRFVRPWEHPKTQEIHGLHTRRSAVAAIIALELTA